MFSEEEIRKAFVNRLELACRQKGLPDKGRGIQIANELKISAKAVSKWFNAETMPSTANIYSLAAFLGVTPEWLNYGDVSEVQYVGRPKEGLIKVLGEAMMGADGEFEMAEELMGFVRMYSSDPDAYCLKVKGNSMEPRILSGEYVVIEPNAAYYPTDEVFVRTVDGKNMIKVMDSCRDGEYRFSSVNKEHRSFTLDYDEVDTVAAVAAIVKRSRFISLDEIQDVVFE